MGLVIVHRDEGGPMWEDFALNDRWSTRMADDLAAMHDRPAAVMVNLRPEGRDHHVAALFRVSRAGWYVFLPARMREDDYGTVMSCFAEFCPRLPSLTFDGSIPPVEDWESGLVGTFYDGAAA